MKTIPFLSILWVIIITTTFSANVDDAYMCDLSSAFGSVFASATNWNCSTHPANVCVGSTSKWVGVSCFSNRVISISISRKYGTVGTLSSSIGQLSMLSSLRIQNLLVGGTLTSTIGNLKNLKSLILSSNCLSGSIPSTVGILSSLTNLNISGNNLNGMLPSTIGLLQNLEIFDVSNNLFMGTIPSTIGNTSNLSYLSLFNNKFNYLIPTSIIFLTNLQYLDISSNFVISSTIPMSIYQLLNLKTLKLSNNRFIGTISSMIGNFIHLEYLDMSLNSISGSIPSTISLLSSSFVTFLANNNKLTGLIPSSIKYLQQLQTISLKTNCLSGTIPNELGQLTNLISLSIGSNYFNGTIPNSITYLIKLQSLLLTNVSISGTIPSAIGNMMSLTYLSIQYTSLSGTLPSSIGSLTKLQSLYVKTNLRGALPWSIGYLTNLNLLDLSNNLFTGTLPNSIGNLINLQSFTIANNRFSGIMPSSIGNIMKAQSLVFSNNLFTGMIPTALCRLSQSLNYLDISYNRLVGSIVSCLSSLSLMSRINLGSNAITGTIPSNLNSMKALTEIDVDYNMMSGTIPSILGYLTRLTVLKLNNNKFYGQIPTSLTLLRRMTQIYLFSNRLTGPVENLFNMSTTSTLKFIDVSNNLLTGHISGAVFRRIPLLTVFAATANCLQITLSDDVCTSSKLQAFVIDGIGTASKCRETYTSGLYSLTRTQYQTIPSCLFSMAQLSTLHLSGNDLSGTIPVVGTMTTSLRDLVLSYNRLGGTIPVQFQDTQWDRLDVSFNMLSGDLPSIVNLTKSGQFSARNNRLSGDVPPEIRLLHHIDILEGNLFNCDFNDRLLPASDPSSSSFRCGSDTFQLSIYIWCGLMTSCLVIAYLQYSTIRTYLTSLISFLQYENTSKLAISISRWRRLCVFLTVLVLVVLTPTYGVLKVWYGTHYYEYAWTVSIAYLTGRTPATAMLALLAAMFALTLRYYGCRPYQRRMIIEDQTVISNEEVMTEGLAIVRSAGSSLTALTALSAILLFNCGVVFLANSLYVYATLSASTKQLFGTQIFIGLFKTLWKQFFVRNIHGIYQLVFSPSHDIPEFSVVFLFLILVMNNIIIPTVAETAVDSNCISDLLFTPHELSVSYSYSVCTLFALGPQAACAASYRVVNSASCVPPFTYRYQCSSTIISNYSSVFVYMFLLTALKGPLMHIMLRVREKLKGYDHLYFLISLGVEDYYIKPAAFNASFYLAELTSNIAILLTFGVAFPPVAFVLCIAVCVDSAFTLHHLNSTSPDVMETVPNADTSIIGMLVVLTALFFSFFLYDIMGAQSSIWNSLWASSILLGISIVLVCTYTFFVSRCERRRKVSSLANVSSIVRTNTANLQNGEEKDLAAVKPMESPRIMVFEYDELHLTH